MPIPPPVIKQDIARHVTALHSSRCLLQRVVGSSYCRSYMAVLHNTKYRPPGINRIALICSARSRRSSADIRIGSVPHLLPQTSSTIRSASASQSRLVLVHTSVSDVFSECCLESLYLHYLPFVLVVLTMHLEN